jgi:ankyrin repeat protein
MYMRVLSLVLFASLSASATFAQNQSQLNDALWHAASNGDLNEVERLVNVGANVNYENSATFGSTPLMVAAGNGYLNIVDYLVSHGANVNAVAFLGSTALGGSLFHFDVFQFLVIHGADVNSTTFSGETELMGAAADGCTKAIGILLNHGAQIDARDNSGETALMKGVSGVARSECSEQNNNVDAMNALLDAGAQVNAEDNQGKTALMKAAEEGHLDIVKLLLAHGADPNDTNHEFLSALDLATQKNRTGVIELLQGKTDLRQVLQEQVVKLQSSTFYDGLREHIIECAAKLTPPPSIPADAEAHFRRGLEIMQQETTSIGILGAAEEFDAAANIAPWYALAYYKAAVAWAKAGDTAGSAALAHYNYTSALHDLKIYMFAAPDASSSQEVRQLQQKLNSEASASTNP